jgi:hypothetical protein
MDSFNYFNQLEAYGQARQLYETFQQDKDEILSAKDDTAGGLGLASSGELLQKSLNSQTFKDGLSKLLKTGNNDVDSAVKNSIDNITTDSNPTEVLSDLATNLKPVLQSRALGFVRGAFSKLMGREPLQVGEGRVGDSELNSTVQNRAFEENNDAPFDMNMSEIPQADPEAPTAQTDQEAPMAQTDPEAPMAEEDADAVYDAVLRGGRGGQDIPDDLIPEGAGSRVLNGVSDRVSNLSQEVSNRASGVLEDIPNRISEQTGDLVENLQTIPGRLQSLMSQGASNISQNVQSRLQGLQSQAQDQADVALARLNPSGSTSNQIGDLLRGNVNIASTSEAESSGIGSTLENLGSTVAQGGRDMLNSVAPQVADVIPDSVESAVSSGVDQAGDALATGLSTASDALLGGSSVEEAVGAALDSTGVLAPIGALLGLFGLGGSLASILDHHASRPSFNGAQPTFEPGL